MTARRQGESHKIMGKHVLRTQLHAKEQQSKPPCKRPSPLIITAQNHASLPWHMRRTTDTTPPVEGESRALLAARRPDLRDTAPNITTKVKGNKMGALGAQARAREGAGNMFCVEGPRARVDSSLQIEWSDVATKSPVEMRASHNQPLEVAIAMEARMKARIQKESSQGPDG